MSDREKILAGAIGVLLAVFGVFFVLRSVQTGLKTRESKIASMNKRIKQAEDEKMFALEDAMLVREFKLRSLDENADKAHFEFSHWLEQQVEEVGLAPKTVRFVDFTQRKDEYQELTYTVSGEGNLQRITDLLYRVQSADTLHCIKRLTVRRITDDTSRLKLDMNVIALSMGPLDVPKNKIGTISPTKLTKSLDEYSEAIVVRNVFAPANNAPRFDRLRRQTVEVGKTLNVALAATDVDGHDLEYRLLDAPDDSAKVQGKNLVWQAQDLGEYEFQVEVEDSGMPAKRAVATVRVNVVPERKPAPREVFDDATVTELTGVVRGPRDAGLQIWLKVQSKDEYLSLGAGDKIDVGQWQGRVKSVQRQRAVLESEDGREYELGLGEILSNATPVESGG